MGGWKALTSVRDVSPPETITQKGTGLQRIEAEQADDARQEPKGGARLVEFPIGDRAGVDAELLGDLALEQAQGKPAPPEVVAKGAEHMRNRVWQRLLSS